MLPLRHEFVPITDFPEHAATIATLSDLWRNGPLASWYQTNFLHTQYWLMAVLGALLAPLVGGAVPALKWLLVASSIGLMAALLRLARVLGLDERLVLVAIPLLWSRPFTMGFIPFVMAAPLVALAFAEVGGTSPPHGPRHVVIAALGLATFLLNLTSLAWLLVGSLAIALGREGFAAWPVARRLPGVLVLSVPTAAWLAFSDVANVDASRFGVPMQGRWWSPPRLTEEAPEWLMDHWHGPLDSALLGLLLVAVVSVALPFGEREEAAGHRPVLWLWLATGAVCLALPFERGWLWGLNARFLPAFVMLAPLALSRRRGALRAFGLALAGLVGLVSLWNTERQTATAQDELRGVAILKGLPPGARLLQLTFDDRSTVARDSLVRHAGAYHRVWNLGPNEPSFVDLPQSVLRYRGGRAPWTRLWPWETSPEGYDNAREGRQYDFVLTRGVGGSFPPEGGAPGPAWRLLREDGAFRLYAREPAALVASAAGHAAAGPAPTGLERLLVTLRSDPEGGIEHTLSLAFDAHNRVECLVRRTGRDSEVFSFAQVRTGATLASAGGRPVIRLSCARCDPERGGRVRLSYLHNGIINSFNVLDLDWRRGPDGTLALYRVGGTDPIRRLRMTSRRFLGILIGIDEILIEG
jgi:hypothetical protein